MGSEGIFTEEPFPPLPPRGPVRRAIGTRPRRLTVPALLAGIAVLGLLPGALGAPAPAASASPAVSPAVPASLTVPALLGNATIDLGMALNLSVDTANITGGSGNVSQYSFVWHGLPHNCTSSDVANLSCVPDVAGNSTVDVTVSDPEASLNGTSPPLDVAVHTDPAIVAFSVTPTSGPTGGEFTFTVTASGGTPPLSYAYAGLPGGCNGAGATFSCAPTLAEAYNVTVVVTDAVGGSSDPANVTVSVTNPAGGGGTSAGPSLVDWAAIGAILVIGFAIAALLFVRAGRLERAQPVGRRREAPPPPTAPPPPSGGPPP